MKYQDYKCRDCDFRWLGSWYDSDSDIFKNHLRCPRCLGSDLGKVFSVSVPRPMQEHYNPATGQVESSLKTIREKFKAASDEATERTGIPHNFQPIDLRDKAAVGVTDEGLDATYKRKRDVEGLPSTKTIIT